MLSADNETSGPEGPRISCGVDQGLDGVSGDGAGQNLGVEAGIKKRKAAILSRDSNNLLGSGGLEVECEAYRTISMDIENLRSQLDEDVKELGYCEENEKLRAEMDLKDKEMLCLRKQNEELQIKYEKQNEELQANYEKQNDEWQAKFEKLNEELQAKYKKQTEGLQAKFEKLSEELQAKYEKQNDDLQSKCEKQKDELQAKYEKQNEEVQAKNVDLHKNIVCTLGKQIDAKKKQLRQLEGSYMTMEFSLAQLEECKEIPDKSCDEDPNSKLVDQSSAEISGVDRKAEDEMLKKQKLEMEVAKLDAEIEIKMNKLCELLEDEKLIEELGSATVWKSIQANNELQEIRRQLIRVVFNETPTRRRVIGIKRIGELDPKPVEAACQRKYGADEFQDRACKLTCVWQERTRPSTLSGSLKSME